MSAFSQGLSRDTESETQWNDPMRKSINRNRLFNAAQCTIKGKRMTGLYWEDCPTSSSLRGQFFLYRRSA